MEQSTTPKRQPDKRRPQRQRKYKYASSVGALFVIFAVIGALAVIFASIQLTRSALDNAREKEMFAKKIQPVLMFDPVPFESAATLDNKSLLFYSMWTILSADDAEKYPKTESQEIIIPASDLDAAAFSLFGDSVTLEHTSFGDDFNGYIYVKEDERYLIPPAGDLYVYTAVVEEIRKDGEYYNLIVGYIPPPDAWTTIYAGGVTNEVDKTMIYVMKPVGDRWNLVMIADDPNSPSLLRLQTQNEAAQDGAGEAAQSAAPSESTASAADSTDTPDKSPEIVIKSSDDSSESDSSASDASSSGESSDGSSSDDSSASDDSSSSEAE